MADDLELALRIKADVKSALDGLDALERGVAGAGGSMRRAAPAAGAFSRGIRQLVAGDLIARGLTAIARNAREMATDLIRAGTAAESIGLAMRAAIGTDQGAAQALAFVAQESARLALSLPEAERAFVSLSAATRGTRLEGEATRELFRAVGEAARALGLSTADQTGIFTAFEQIVSKGVVSAEELRGQIGERLPGAFQLAARAMGVTTQELDKMLRQGELLAEDLLPRLAAALRREYGAAAEAAGGTADAAFVRLDNAIVELQRTIAGSGILDFFGTLADQVTDIVAAVRRGLEARGLVERGPPLNERDAEIRLREARERYESALAEVELRRSELPAARRTLEEAAEAGFTPGLSGQQALAGPVVAIWQARVDDAMRINAEFQAADARLRGALLEYLPLLQDFGAGDGRIRTPRPGRIPALSAPSTPGRVSRRRRAALP